MRVVVDKVMRYESHLNKQLTQTLHQLERWQAIRALLRVPDSLELMAVYRLGYLPQGQPRPSIDWSSRHRKRLNQFVFRETCAAPEQEG